MISIAPSLWWTPPAVLQLLAEVQTVADNQGELDKLSPAQQTYVNDNYGDLLKGGDILINVSTPKGNGGEPVITLQTAALRDMMAANPSQTYSVQTHYHGDIWHDNPTFFDKNTIVDAMQRLWKKDATAVFVLPQTQVFGAAKGTTPVGDQQGFTAWNNVSDEKETTETALAEAGLDPARATDKTVSGHSSGGYPLARVMTSTAKDPSAPRIDANRILVLDTVKGELSDSSIPEWWHTHHPGVVTYVDAVMHSFSRKQADDWGWTFLTAKDHFDAVQSFLDYGR